MLKEVVMNMVSVLFVLTSIMSVLAQDVPWDYDENGPSTWGRGYPVCNDEQQSPIALYPRKKNHGCKGYKPKFQNYDNPVNGVFSNTGYTVNIVFNYEDPASRAQVEVREGRRSNKFYLQSLHFHWPGEHTFDDRRKELEMHMVHRSSDNGTLVLGYLFDNCSSSETRTGSLTSRIPEIVNYHTSVNVENFVPSQIMPASYHCNYYIYTGSLTTPPCTEGVLWHVHDKVSCISGTELNAFYTVRDADGELLFNNYRPIQPRNGRCVYHQRCGFFFL